MASLTARINPRKSPLQARSRAMVELILDATTRVLVEEGLAYATTNRVAERAGISVGSLYQYFPGREALLAAVARRHANRVKEALEAALAGTARLNLREALATMIAAVAAAHAADPELHRVLAEELPRLGDLDWKGESAKLRMGLLQDLLAMHRDEVRPGLDYAAASFLIATLAEGAMTAACRQGYSAAEAQVIKRELMEVIVRYVMA